MSDDVPPETVESKMCTRFPRVKMGDSVGDIEEMLSQHTNQFDSIDYIYVVDDENILEGVISIKKVFSTQDNETKVENIMKKDLVKVTPPTGQDRIVYLALSHGLKALPVVDDENLQSGS